MELKASALLNFILIVTSKYSDSVSHLYKFNGENQGGIKSFATHGKLTDWYFENGVWRYCVSNLLYINGCIVRIPSNIL